MAELGKAYVQVIPSAQGMKGALGKAVTSEAGPAGVKGGQTLASKMKGVIAKAGIGLAVGATLKKALGEGAKLEQSMGGIETLFKGSADTVIKNAQNAYKTAGLSANEYMETVTSFSASLLQSLGGDTEKAATSADQALRDMSDNANKFGTDMGSIQNAYQGFAKQNYTMLDNLKLGYGGTKSEMERLLADASKLSGVEYDISSLDDVYQAIHVVQEEMGVTGTTAEEASKTMSGSAAAMKAAFSNVLGNLATGGDVTGALRALFESTSTFVFNNLFPMLGNIFKQLPSVLSFAIQEGIPSILGAASQMVTSLVGYITENLPTLVAEGTAMITELGMGFIQNIPEYIDMISELIPQVVSWVSENLPVMLAQGGLMIGKLAQGLIDNMPAIMSALGRLGRALLSGLQKLIPSLLNAGVRFIQSIASGMSKTLGRVKTAVGNVVKSITDPIHNAVEKIKGFFPISIGNLLKNIKLPHFSLGWGEKDLGKLGTVKYPTGISVQWYAKGGILNNPTLFGLAGGENGPEGIVPLDPFWAKLDAMADDIVNGVQMVTRANGSGGDITIPVYLFPSGPKMEEVVVKAYDRGKFKRGGRPAWQTT